MHDVHMRMDATAAATAAAETTVATATIAVGGEDAAASPSAAAGTLLEVPGARVGWRCGGLTKRLGKQKIARILCVGGDVVETLNGEVGTSMVRRRKISIDLIETTVANAGLLDATEMPAGMGG